MNIKCSEGDAAAKEDIRNLFYIKREEPDKLTPHFNERSKNTTGSIQEQNISRINEGSNDQNDFINHISYSYVGTEVKTENSSVDINNNIEAIGDFDEGEACNRSENECYNGEKTFTCDYCGKSFGKKSFLVLHCHTHSPGKLFTCELCGKSFDLKLNLVAHSFIHSGKKKDNAYICEICGKYFSEIGTLTKHYAIHTSQKPHRCDLCTRSFSYKWSLKRHYLIHTRERPHSFDMYNQIFRDKKTLLKHREEHVQQILSCEICGNTFLNKYSLGRHYQSHALLHEMLVSNNQLN